METTTKLECISLITQGEFTCVIYKDGVTHCYSEPGVRTLFTLLKTNPSLLEGSYVFDKIIGKGAAALMITGHVAHIWGDYISEGALKLLSENNLEPEYQHLVPVIENRDRTGMCPIEKLCMPLATPQECYQNIESFLRNKPK